MRASDLSGFVAAVLTLALAFGVHGLSAQSRHSPDEPGPSQSLCWQGCAAVDRQDTGQIRSRIVHSPGGQPEDVLVGPPGELVAAQAAVESAGGRILRVSRLPGLGLISQIAVFSGSAPRERALARLARTARGTRMSANWTYEFAQPAELSQPAELPRSAPRLYAPQLIGDPGPGRCRLSRMVRIGMIDGPVNPAHPALRGARLHYQSLTGGLPAPSADHGTAVAGLLIGEDPSGILSGFAGGAELHAVSVFWRQDGRAETSVERIVEALDLLVGRDIRLINMSFAGPRSDALRRALAAAAAGGVVMVGASGNEGARQVAFPAEAEEVIAITAVDSARRRYRLANTGNEIEFSAPGVDVYVALTRGGGYGSGTSFATPIVTALIARAMARGTSSVQGLRGMLRTGVEPLGNTRRSADFGYGLVRAVSC